MSGIIRQSDHVDIMLLCEGTYPYIRGGVSSWIHQLMQGLPHFTFGVIFLGSVASDYGEVLYTLPDNLLHLEVHYLFDRYDDGEIRRVKDHEAFEHIYTLHDWFNKEGGSIPDGMKDIRFYTEQITYGNFLHSKQSWRYINERYLENCPDVPFIDYFWTVKSIHRPIWQLAKIVAAMPSCKVLHSPSTGYAGLLGTLCAYDRGTPFLLTEHGIYTKERKIDMLTADWVSFKKAALLQQPEESNYIKGMWMQFFEQIGLFCYERADLILSLFSGAKEAQIALGAKREKTEVVPNGVDVDGLYEAYLQRPKGVPKVITLIGRVVSIKDIKTFIRAIHILVMQKVEVEAWVVGPLDEDEEYADECHKMVESLGLEAHFIFKGFQNIKAILPKTGLLTLTSISEGMPLTILEGFAAGVPCVATDVGSCRDLICGGLGEEDHALGVAGAVTAIADPSALARSYRNFLEDEEVWSAAQKAALTRVQRYYRQDSFLATYQAIYEKAMGSWQE